MEVRDAEAGGRSTLAETVKRSADMSAVAQKSVKRKDGRLLSGALHRSQ